MPEGARAYPISDELGKAAYDTYCEAVGGMSVGGDKLPTWDEQVANRPKVAQAWRKAAIAAVHKYAMS